MNTSVDKCLFLLGGPKACYVAASSFIEVATQERNNHILYIVQDENGWKKYGSGYIEPLQKCGMRNYSVVMPDENGNIDIKTLSKKIKECTGIFIGGGHTPTYQHLYAEEPVRSVLVEAYNQGVPLAGMSAGALIMPEYCLLNPEETGENTVILKQGLSIIKNLLVAVHFSEWNQLPFLLEGMKKSHTSDAWGIDEGACIVVKDEIIETAYGNSAYKVYIEDWETISYQMERLSP